MSTREQFVFFWSGPFSQWHHAPFEVEGRAFVCAEQFMMYCKAKLFGDYATAERILQSASARTHKTLGRQVVGFDEETWRLFREGIVYTGNLAKFSQNSALSVLLLSTGRKVIVEASPKDTVWGVGLDEKDSRIVDPSQWRGTNLLGKSLMRVRSWLRDQP